MALEHGLRLVGEARGGDISTVTTPLAPAEVEVEEPRGAEEPEHDRPWIVIVWNDPINLISYVTLVFQELFAQAGVPVSLHPFYCS